MSTADRFARLDAALDELLDLPPSVRTDRAGKLFSDEPELLASAMRLLRAAEEDGPLDAPAMLLDVPDPADPWIGVEVGPYRVEDVLGEGGMGRVYRGRRVDGAFETEVAIKRIRAEVVRTALVQRFASERSILAAIEHPGIARLLDAGSWQGVPYLIMEYVRGASLLEHLDEQDLEISARLHLLARLCDAVEHAHGRLIVHRDIKPANIRVRDNGHPVLLDFGIAKLLSSPEADQLTKTGDRAFTPRWSAPEQREGRFVGTAADVYALGLVAERILVGPRPSEARLTPRTGSGDLHFVLKRAMAESPEERYASAGALGADFRALAGGLRVAAREGRVYRAWAFARAHAVAVSLAALCLALLIAYAVTLTLQQQALELERDRARQEATRARRSSDFLEGMLLRGVRGSDVGEAVTVATILERAEATLDTDDVNNLDLLLLSARAQSALGEHDAAAELASSAWTVAARELQPGDTRGLEALHVQSLAEERATRHDDALATATRLVREATAHRGLWSGWTGRGLIAQADALDRNAPQDATPRYALGLALVLMHDGPWSEDAAVALIGLGFAQWDSKSVGAWLIERGIRILVHLHGEQHLRVADALQKLAHQQSEPSVRVATLERALAIEVAVAGPTHPWVANSLNDLGLMLESNDPARAADLLRQALTIVEFHEPEGSPRRSMAAANLGAVLLGEGQLDAASEVLETAWSHLDPPERSCITVGFHLGRARAARGETKAARDVLETALEATRSHKVPPDRVERIELELAKLTAD
ncbi:MAG: protein kinase domain-containing protein [Nannocystales bacterium]